MCSQEMRHMTKDKLTFELTDVIANKDMAALGYVLFFLPLITCRDSRIGRFCANQGLLLLLAYVAARIVLGMFSWLLIFDFIYELAVSLLGISALALGVFMAWRLRKHDEITRLPFIGKYTLIK